MSSGPRPSCRPDPTDPTDPTDPMAAPWPWLCQADFKSRPARPPPPIPLRQTRTASPQDQFTDAPGSLACLQTGPGYDNNPV